MQARQPERETCCVRCGIRMKSRVETPICWDCLSDRWFLAQIGVTRPLPPRPQRESVA